MIDLKIGDFGESHAVVSHEMTAAAVGSGALPVMATPIMLALMEAAAVNALAQALQEGFSTVGIAADIEHLSATPVGELVRTRAEITGIEGKRIDFFVQAWDDKELIGEGTHARYIIDEARFMQRVRENSTNNPTPENE